MTNHPASITTQTEDCQLRQKSNDFTVVKTRDPTPRSRESIFGLKEAPVYYPTLEEFEDPLSYINTIRKEAEAYGIAKIVPPKEYKANLYLDTQSYHFTTRIQQVNGSKKGEKVSHGSDCMDNARKFTNSVPRKDYPPLKIGRETVNLYKLKLAVEMRGGHQVVSAQKLWPDIGQELGVGPESSSSIEIIYDSWIPPYELWLAKISKLQNGSSLSGSPADVKPGKPQQCDICMIIDSNKKADLLYCMDCDHQYHPSCLPPVTSSLPTIERLCPNCLSGPGGCYGVEDNYDYSLDEFRAICDKFKKSRFSKETSVSEQDCEKEFWRTVNNSRDTCQVEYGIGHYKQNGDRSNDPWNLSTILYHPESLTPHMKSPGSDIMAPWLYIGMCFAFFCWHNEHHYNYSIDYMHYGDTKTWYGVPGADTEKFERIVLKALSNNRPEHLIHMTPMLNPGELLKKKIPVYAIDQHVGEFVVTFPKAYHSGFSHGFNICEQTNFTTADWIPFGVECAKRYQIYKRLPHFSMDQLLTSITNTASSKESGRLILDGIQLMRQKELDKRQKAIQRYARIKTRKSLDTGSNSSSRIAQLQCSLCFCHTYLSFVACSCSNIIRCIDHISAMCACQSLRKTIYIRFNDDELLGLVNAVDDLIPKLSKWMIKARRIAADCTIQTIEPLQYILLEATEANATEKERSALEDYIENIQQLENDVASVLSTYQQQKDGAFADNTKSLDDNQHFPILNLLNKISRMSWKSPAIIRLESLVDGSDLLKKQVERLINSDNPDPQEIQTTYDIGKLLNADKNEMYLLYKLICQQHWINELEPRAMQLPLNYDALKALVEQAEECGLPLSNEKYQRALLKTHLGEIWATKARRVLPLDHPQSIYPAARRHIVIEYGTGKQRYMTIDDLDDILYVDQDVPIIPNIYQDLKAFHAEISSWLDLFENTITQGKQNQIPRRPTAEDIRCLKKAGRRIPTQILRKELAILNCQLERLDDWKDELKALLVGGLNTDAALEVELSRMHSEVARATIEDRQAIKKNDKRIKKRQRTKFDEHFCICRDYEYGFMLLCDTCGEWYHGDCINVRPDKIKRADPFLCLVCDPLFYNSDKIHRPKMKQLHVMMDKARDLYLTSHFINSFYEIIQKVTSFYNRMCPMLQENADVDIKTVDHYRRILFGLPMVFDEELEVLQRKRFGVLGRHQRSTSIRRP